MRRRRRAGRDECGASDDAGGGRVLISRHSAIPPNPFHPSPSSPSSALASYCAKLYRSLLFLSYLVCVKRFELRDALVRLYLSLIFRFQIL